MSIKTILTCHFCNHEQVFDSVLDIMPPAGWAESKIILRTKVEVSVACTLIVCESCVRDRTRALVAQDTYNSIDKAEEQFSPKKVA